MRSPVRLLTSLAVLASLTALAACGSDDESGSTSAGPATTAAAATATTAAAAATTTAPVDDSAAAATTTVAPSTAAAPTTSDVDLSGVTLNVASSNNALQSLLAASGEDQDFPYQVSYISTASTSVALEGVKAGDVDLFGSGELPGIFGAAAGVEFQLIAAYYKNVNATGVLIPKDSEIATVADLQGKTIAVNAGSNAQKVLYRALATVGLGPDDIELVNLQPADALPAFVSGAIDAWATFDPNTSVAEVTYGARMLVDGSNGIHSGVNYWAASDAAIEDPAKAAAIGDYLTRLKTAEEWSAQPENKQAYLELQATLTKLDPAVNEWIYDRGPNEWRPITDDVVADTQQTADEFAALGANPDVDMSPYFTTAFNAVLFPNG